MRVWALPAALLLHCTPRPCRLRHWEVLEWLLWVNSHGELVYRAGYGDKDTFRLAFTLAGAAAKFQLCEHPPAVLLSNWRWKVSWPKGEGSKEGQSQSLWELGSTGECAGRAGLRL